MGNGFSAVLEPFQSVAKSVGDGIKGIKLPDNLLKDVSLGNKGRHFFKGIGNRIQSIKLPDNLLKDVSLGNNTRNFVNGVSSGIIGPRKARVQVRTGPFGLGRATQLRSVSSTPMSVSGLLGEAVGHTVSLEGRTETKPIISSNKRSLFNRIKNKFKPNSNPIIPSNNHLFVKSNKPNNIGTSNNSQIQPLEQPPQKTQEEFPTQIKGGSKKKPSENKKKPSKKEKNPSGNKKKPSKKEKKPSENKKKPSGNKKKPSENKKKPSKKEKNPSGKIKKPSENKKKSKK